MTLTDVLTRAATVAPGQGMVHADTTDRFIGYAELLADALRIGGGLREAGLRPGDPLLVAADDGADFLALFWGAVVAGVVPVPLPPEPRRLDAVHRRLGGPPFAGDIAAPGATLLSPRDLRSASPLQRPHPVRPDDLAFLQFSSGSTGTPKGVELTHANVVANLEQAARTGALTPADVVVTWMPYFHDMGLIGTHLAPLYSRCRQVRISPLTFAKRPGTWLRIAARHRATVLSAANFALALVNRRVPDEALDELDLSTVRLLMVGAEPISPSVWRTFETRLRRAGLAPGAMQPVYGLAEATVAVACPPLGEPAAPLRLSRTALSRGVALPVPAPAPGEGVLAASSSPAGAEPSAVLVMDVGHPVPGCELRVVDDSGAVLEDGLVGHLQVRGPNVTRGYHRDPVATAAAFDGDWLRTGDIGFLRSGRLCVTGRHKDVLFVNGRNFHAADLEEVAAATVGLAPGPIAVVGATDPADGRERVTVFIAAPAVRPDPVALPERVRRRVAEALAHDDVRAEVVPTGAFTRTTSGKLRRQPLRDRVASPAGTADVTPGGGEHRPDLAADVLPLSRGARDGGAAPAGSGAPGAGGPPPARDAVERTVRDIWARVLGVPAAGIGPDDRFLAIGGSSLTAMEVLAGLEDAFGRTLDPVVLRDCATVPALADRLVALCGPAEDAGTTVVSRAGEPDPGGDRGELAVIGMACRFPGADSPAEFWDNLLAGHDSVTEVTRWPGGGHGAFLADPAAFDAGYFGIGEDEARLLDPHARIFLELAHEALERAGYAGSRRTRRRVGVFAAVGESDYRELAAGSDSVAAGGAHALTGALRNLIAARVAHLLNLRGPALAVDTACSSALVALHLARLSLAAGDCDVAVVGGVSLNLTATGESLLAAAQALSPTGRSRAFSADADGFVPGEGGAALVLVRLADAGDDPVLAVVRGSAVNNDGRSLSLMAPNPLLQREVIAQAYRSSGVDPADVTYVEAHGTGTAIGDPIEARSLAHVFGPRPDGAVRLLGSVKTNIGHLLNAAGMPALVKVILALQHRELPPSLHYSRPSERFDLAAAGFEMVTARRPWTGPLVAGVNGFGFGGTNAHVILAAAPAASRTDPEHDERTHLLTLSARSAPGLLAAAGDLAAHLRAHPGLRMADVCASVAAARDDGPYRIALLTGSDLPARLAAVQPGAPLGRPARVAFLFGGQGVPRPGLGAELYATAPVFRAVLDEVSAATGPVAGRTLTDWCVDAGVPEPDLARAEGMQPLAVAFAVAQAAQLAAFGVRPEAVAGDGAGELAAAVSAGRLTAVEAVLLAAGRGRRIAPAPDAVPVAVPPARAATIPQISMVTLEWESSAVGDRPPASPTGPAGFAAVAGRLLAAGIDTMVEVGGAVTLSSRLPETHVLPAGEDTAALLATAGELWVRGVPLDRTGLDAGTRRVALPTYPFQRRRFWITDACAPAAPEASELVAGPVGLSRPVWTESPVSAAGDPAAGVTVLAAGSADEAEALAAIRSAPVDGRLLVITRDLFATGPERPDAGHAVWAGLAMAFADENPGAGVRIVDLCSTDHEDTRRAAVEQESLAPPAAGPAQIVAWRGGRRLTRSFVPVAPVTSARGGTVPPRDGTVPPDGDYLIVGGAGAAGAAIARHLARRGRPRLLLAGRSAAPVALLDELRRLGADADYRVADVTVAEQVAALVAGRAFDVVIQAAGTVSPGSLRARTAAEVSAGMAAKVRGTLLLTQALGGHRPLFVALSSVSSVLPGLAGAVGDYVAANLFLDSFAATQRAAGWPFVSVGLPALTGGGLAAAHRADLRPGSMPIEQVPATLWAAAAAGVAQVLVTPRAADTAVAPPAALAAAPVPDGGGADRDALVAVLRELLAGPLERDADTISADEPFLTLGLDSLTAVDLVKELERRLGRTLSTTLFFEHRTIGELAGHLAGSQRTVFALSPVQQAFVTAGRLCPDVPAYAYVRQTLGGPVDADRLAVAFAALQRRHPMLRSRIGPGGQHVVAPGTGRPEWFTVVEYPAEPAITGSAHHPRVEELDRELRNRVFDLERHGPLRAVLVVEGPELAHLIVVAHHAAADGYSLAILGDELWSLYDDAAPGAAPERTFTDHEALRPPVAAADLEHWRTVLAGYPRLRLPYDGDIDEQPSGPYAVHQTVVDSGISERVTTTAKNAGVSVFHLLLAGYVRCLARWSGQDAVPVAVARAGRTARLPGIEQIVGPFADTLPVLAVTRAGESAVALAGRLRELWLTAERHGSVSTVDLAPMLPAGLNRPRTASPASFSFARFPGARRTGANVLATTAGTVTAATRLGLVCFEAHGTLHFSWNYSEALFRPETVERLAAEYLAEITALAGGSTGSASVVDRIRQQCRRTPDGIAVLTGGTALSYRDLDLASDRLAGQLAGSPAARIGLLTSPGADSVIGVLGILKAGAAWVPLDAAHPPARLAGLLTRAGASVVVCDEGTREAADSLARRGFGTVATDAGGPGTAPVVSPADDDTAYVIFTSGSTGRPKGVAVSHQSMAGYLDWAITTFGYRPGDRLAQTASICFDASVRQMLAPLLVGATVVAWDRDTVRDPELLLDLLVRDRVTVWSSVPALWERLLTAAERTRPSLSLRWVHIGGEELSPAPVRRWFDLFGPEQRITNLYGPTETTINATWHAITERPADDVTRLPIGRPVGGAVVEIVDADGHRCADGDTGEIWIGGRGLTAGYLDDPEQTAAAFTERAGQRWYRSGDLGVRDAGGLLWFRGRADDQIKLHGYRIEPGEVEAALRQHPDVERAVVTLEDGQLVARVQVPAGGRSAAVDAAALRAHLSALLPDYLVPGRIVPAGELPLTVTGKTDRVALRAGGEPVTPTERLLAQLWSRQLKVPAVAREDDFFALGGDSIAVLELFASLGEHRAQLPRPTVVYRHRTLAALAAAIDATGNTPPAVPVGGGDFAATLTQRGFLLADAVGAPSTWLAAPRLHGPLDRLRFQRVVDLLVARHPMLRTVFPAGARPAVQRELPSMALTVGYSATPLDLDRERDAERAHRFDPAVGPLVRLRLLRYGPHEHVLLVHAHHLVGDGYSVALLMRELLTVYDGAEPQPLRSAFRDYVAVLDRIEPEVAPHDGGPPATAGEIVTAGLTVGAETLVALRDRAVAAGVTPFVPVLAAYRQALADVTGRPDPVIGVAVTGRDHSLPDLGRIFGPCATAVAVRPGADAGLAEVAAAVDDARTRTYTAPRGWQHFFTWLDFGALVPAEPTTLELTWDDTDSELSVPPGTEVLLAVRPTGDGLRLTLRCRHSREVLTRLTAAIADNLERRSRPSREEPSGLSRAAGVPLDAALVGYLPAPGQWTGLPANIQQTVTRLDRETLRGLIFPDGRPRLLEITETRLGRSGFVALPRFADELAAPGLAGHAAAAVDLAAAHGARTVSLAGMIPAGTGYGTAVLPYVTTATNLTTGHAVTAAAVVRTVHAALSVRNRKLSDCVVAVLGMGSIGTSSLSLLLARGEPPAGLVLCDLPAAAARLAALAGPLGAQVATSPDAVYQADVIVAATSSGPGTLDVDRLKPGTILVDDSFPHCFDTGRALARMRGPGDVLVVGGGLLACGETRHEVAEGLPDVRHQLPGSMASCRLESLLHATVPGLPLVHGPVTPAHAAAYWDALDAAGVGAAPLHLLNERLDPERDV